MYSLSTVDGGPWIFRLRFGGRRESSGGLVRGSAACVWQERGSSVQRSDQVDTVLSFIVS